jgi:putative polyhydroxyalkanoate system protein
MSQIHIRRKHYNTLEGAKAVINDVAIELGENHNIPWKWNGDELEFGKKGLSGTCLVDEEFLEINIKLGFLMFALKPILEREINHHLDIEIDKAKAQNPDKS